MKKRRNEKDPLKILENLAKEYNLASHQELEVSLLVYKLGDGNRVSRLCRSFSDRG